VHYVTADTPLKFGKNVDRSLVVGVLPLTMLRLTWSGLPLGEDAEPFLCPLRKQVF